MIMALENLSCILIRAMEGDFIEGLNIKLDKNELILVKEVTNVEELAKIVLEFEHFVQFSNLFHILSCHPEKGGLKAGKDPKNFPLG
ncbi:hypothetical protein CK203_012620 [Vitis vinifera]|uniref:Uncharacterized protein n=1 Tax=Vitis vinifera TaxID=29760 RepID=A0A438KMH4_VITVI|nr:hypothetical protein CK203_012620 [Vitis vinifera]